MQNKIATFSELYDNIVTNELTIGWIRKIAIPVLFVVIVIPLSYRMGVATYTNNIGLGNLSDLSIALMVFFLILSIFIGVVFGTVTNLAGSIYGPQSLAAKILVATPSPFRKAFGLTYKEIQHLKEIGRTEQSASGWQGGFLSVAVVWFLVENLGLFSTQVIALASIADKTKNINGFSVSILGWSVLWAVICLFEVVMALIVFNYLYSFLGYEPSNRAIIKACEDAQGLIEVFGISKEKSLTIKKKAFIAEKLQCSYVSTNEVSHYKYRTKISVTEQNGKEYFLLTKVTKRDIPQTTAQSKKRKS